MARPASGAASHRCVRKVHGMEVLRPSILVAENHDSIRDTIATVLSMEGYRVVQAADGAEVFGVLAYHVPDLLLLDLSMPRVDGWEVMRAIHQHCPRFPVVIMSATMQAPSIAAELGADGHLIKPFQVADLLRV